VTAAAGQTFPDPHQRCGGCRHSGNKLVWDDFPHEETKVLCRQFTCNHGWRYDLDGPLTFVQQEAEFFDVDKSGYGLDAYAARGMKEFEGFAQNCCLPTEAERWNRRVSSSMAEMRQFYDAFFPRLEEAIDHCDKFPLDDIPEDAIDLLHLIYSLVMVVMAVEIFAQPKPSNSADAVMDRVGEPVRLAGREGTGDESTYYQ
jgi:hypothetical protein